MKMDHITETVCPDCGCQQIRKCEKSNKHSSGQWNERVTFDCGLALHYSPNFERVSHESECTKSEKYKAWKERRQALADTMIEALRSESGASNVDFGSLKRSLVVDLDLYSEDIGPCKSPDRA